MGLDEMSPGKKLQAAREAKGIALGDVSRDTRISAATLKGLEEEDFKFLPRGIYVRAFIKTYCGVLGLEAKVILDEFVEKYPDEVGQIVKSDTVTAFANEEYGKRQVAAAITIVVTVLSVVGLAVVVYLVFKDSPEASDVVVTSVSDTTTMSHNSAAGVVGPEPTIES
ncbi:MAG TPA: helix-turn-helix domain-containing protein, partial [Acidobacteria bacterium]|nr:helix-turn-helix domain-containing protein [Acidobacteriota bacterium]